MGKKRKVGGEVQGVGHVVYSPFTLFTDLWSSLKLLHRDKLFLPKDVHGAVSLWQFSKYEIGKIYEENKREKWATIRYRFGSLEKWFNIDYKYL